MHSSGRGALRALALWHSRRRSVDEFLRPLLQVGPMAVERVSDQLDDLRLLLDQERQAFEAFALEIEGRRGGASIVDLVPRLAAQPQPSD